MSWKFHPGEIDPPPVTVWGRLRAAAGMAVLGGVVWILAAGAGGG